MKLPFRINDKCTWVPFAKFNGISDFKSTGKFNGFQNFK